MSECPPIDLFKAACQLVKPVLDNVLKRSNVVTDQAVKMAVNACNIDLLRYISESIIGSNMYIQRTRHELVNLAAYHGSIEILEYLASKHGISESKGVQFDRLASLGHINVFQYLTRSSESSPNSSMSYRIRPYYFGSSFWNPRCNFGSNLGSISPYTLSTAARFGHMDLIQYLHHSRTEGATEDIIELSVYSHNLEVIQYIVDNNLGNVSRFMVPALCSAIIALCNLEIVEYLLALAHKSNAIDPLNGFKLLVGRSLLSSRFTTSYPRAHRNKNKTLTPTIDLTPMTILFDLVECNIPRLSFSTPCMV
eukprot:gene6779-7881_t